MPDGLAKIDALRDGFYEFLEYVVINSKEFGANTRLAEHIYRAQHSFYESVFDGLARGVHNFFVLKSRQLGMSTAIRPLMIYWAGVHEALQGAMTYDTPFNTARARREVTEIIKSLPRRLHFPQIVRDTREGIELEGSGPDGAGGSQIVFMAAGVKNARSGGGLGRSLGLNFAHCSEISSWVNEEGLTSYRQSMSKTYPDRLYIWETTARGYNIAYRMWREAKESDDDWAALFYGWWSHDLQVIERGTPDFAKYGAEPPNARERKRIDAVRDLYGWQITPEQLAWFRKTSDPTQALDEGDEEDANLLQEQPWTEIESFQMTGSSFFLSDKLTEAAAWAVTQPKPQAYRFIAGIDFVGCEVFPARTRREIELKVWEEPASDSVYVISGDPAFGHNENNNNSAAQVLRCFADGIDQVAEYASATIDPQQFSWLLWTLVGYYGSKPNTVVGVIIEINGPGEEVIRSFDRTRMIVQQGYLRSRAREKGIGDIFTNVRQYIYQRSDSMHAGHNRHWKCLALDTALPTPTGWTLMGLVQVGDRLIDEEGNPCTVIGASEVKYDQECFKVSFDDGTFLVASGDHLWEVYNGTGKNGRKGGRSKKVITTRQLRAKYHFIPVAVPFCLDEAKLPIDPYVLGVWLGDGRSADAFLYGAERDLLEISDYIESAGYSLGPMTEEPTVWRRKIYGLHSALRKLELLKNKHIPDIFLRSSETQRWSLLQGLMDTDGTINPRNGRQCSFSTSSILLAQNFSELIRTLGIKAKMVTRVRSIQYLGRMVECAPAYQFNFTAYPDMRIFRLKRKSDLSEKMSVAWLATKLSKHYKITSVEMIKTVPVRCVAVDSPSHLYLAGEGMVPTHNTNSQLKEAIFVACRDHWANGVLRVRSMEAIEEAKTITRDGATIGAEGRDRDDRVFSLAMGVRHWEDKFRRAMITGNRTREAERARLSVTMQDQWELWNKNSLDMFFKRKIDARMLATRQMQQRVRRDVPRRRF